MIHEKKEAMEFLGLANGEGENLALNFLIRDLRSVARSFLYSVAPFFLFFLIDCTEHATLEEPLEGVDFAPPLFFLFSFSTSERGIKEGILMAKFPINLVSTFPYV